MTAAPDPSVRTPRVKTVSADIVDINFLTHDTVALVVEQYASDQLINPQAGQFCTIQAPGLSRSRAYSLARAPLAENPGELTFLVKLIGDGEFSQWLKSEQRIGSTMEVSGPLGKFVLDSSDSTMVCIAGGSGMSAIFSIIEQAQLLNLTRDCYFFYGVRTSDDLLLIDQINQVAQAWHSSFRFKYVPVLSDEPEGSDWQGARGMVGEVALSTLQSVTDFNWDDTAFYLCGPPLMVNAAVEALLAAGVTEERCRFDRFESAYSPAPIINNKQCVLCDECLLVKPTEHCIVESANIQSSNPAAERVQPLKTSGLYYNALVIDEEHCIRCHACIEACPHQAISIPGTPDAQDVANTSLRQPAG